MKKVKKINERAEAFMRIVLGFISGLILYLWYYLFAILVLVNLVITIIDGKRNRDIAEFAEYWSTEFYRFARYISGMSNERPFPFNKVSKISKFERN